MSLSLNVYFWWQYSFAHSFKQHVVSTRSGLEPHGHVRGTDHGISQAGQKGLRRRVSTSHPCGGKNSSMPG